ncbi:hypothetical protein ACIQYL_21060 [Lysinibacillus xylanilyticus]|uniref:hypothetical protein n=1 Tax=Lysinibacillus xylanilyticus TaxID=582475 RepID=UPI0037F45826
MQIISFAELLNSLYQLQQEEKAIQAFKATLDSFMDFENSEIHSEKFLESFDFELLGKRLLASINFEAVKQCYEQFVRQHIIIVQQVNDLMEYLRKHYASPYNLRHVVQCLREESGFTVKELCEQLDCSLTEWELLVKDGNSSHQLFDKISIYFKIPKFDVYES